MGENRLMADLYEENQRLKERIKELEEKHFSECGQIAAYGDELKALLSKVDIGAAKPKDYLDLLNEWAKMKKLLKAAVMDFRWLEVHTEDGKGHCCISGDNDELACAQCPLNLHDKDTIMCGWNYEDEALALIGEDGDT